MSSKPEGAPSGLAVERGMLNWPRRQGVREQHQQRFSVLTDQGGDFPKQSPETLHVGESSPRCVSIRMHFKWKPLITYTVVAGSVSFARMHFQQKGKLFCQPLDVISGLNMNSRSILKVESRFAACCLNSEEVAPLFSCSFFSWCRISFPVSPFPSPVEVC